MLHIQVTGPVHSGKGHAIAAIARQLSALGAVVEVQSAETHNKEKLEKLDQDLATRLAGVSVRITELQSS